MKKGIATILLLLYVAFSSGVVINLHYCMDRFDSAQFGATQSEFCGKCGMHTTESNGCCHDQVKIFKIDDEQQVAGFSFKFKAPVATINYTTVFNTEITGGVLIAQKFIDHPPPLSKQDSYLQNCVFRI